MHLKEENPAALAGAHRARNSLPFTKATIPFPTPSVGESLAVAMAAGRYRLADPAARTVCELAGLGGRW